MPLPRSSGILLHPTCLPGGHGIGDLGPAAHGFLDFLVDAGQTLWQVLPLGPTGFGDSPYQALSTFAGNPLLVSLDALAADGWLTGEELASVAAPPSERIDFAAVIAGKSVLLDRAATRFLTAGGGAQAAALAEFRRAAAHWLDDFALFMTLKAAHAGASWHRWKRRLAMRDPAALARARRAHAAAIERQIAIQFFFARQWTALKAAAGARGVRLFGDIPIFVAYDSADVWAHRELFHLDAHGAPTAVAGVPPDLFSETGQRWGNPLYDWEALAARDFDWWIERLRHALTLVDVLRIDHFIGFTRYWEIPADAPTAVTGRWVPAPGAAVLERARAALGAVSIVAEDLGVVTVEVDALREHFGLPGMKVLQFAFDGDASNRYLPHNYTANFVVYTGTHDNDTTRGWFRSATPAQRRFARRYLGVPGNGMVGPLVRAALASVADTAVIPLQDVLALDSAARMNFPGQAVGNWTWRLRDGQLTERHARRLRRLAEMYGRVPVPVSPHA